MKNLLFILIGCIATDIAIAKVQCKDFATQAQAQLYMYQYSAYYLDRDNDGEACECLPGGSRYGSSKCRKY